MGSAPATSALVGGVELGGSKAVCVVGAGREIVAEERLPLGESAATLAAIASFFARQRTDDRPISALGVASFGPLELREAHPDFGRITATPKPGWSRVDLVRPLREALGVPTVLDTDVNAAALAEGRFGAARGCSNLVYLTVGTGIGAGRRHRSRPLGLWRRAGRRNLRQRIRFRRRVPVGRTGRFAATEGELSELVLTNLGRVGSPVVRYRTGDLVRPSWTRAGANRFVFLPGGVLARTDDMMVIRGVNVFPSSVEQILRSFPEVVEYQMTVRKQGEMDQLLVKIEDRLNDPSSVADELRLRLGLKVEVETTPLGSLPRVEGKGKRFVDQRTRPGST